MIQAGFEFCSCIVLIFGYFDRMVDAKFSFYEFFAGGGMVRAGLGNAWKCTFANDFDRKKAVTYTDNWGENAFICADIRNISPDDMPGTANLAWGSFPCQDLSLAGGGAGLKGDRSGTFWPFISHMRELSALGRAPDLITLENVLGTLTSHKGADFVSICSALSGLGYRFGALVIDASHFVPQSRPRLFIVGVRSDMEIPASLQRANPVAPWHNRGILRAFNDLPQDLAKDWLWWNLPEPPIRHQNFIDLIEDNPTGVSWHSSNETTRLLSMMSEVNLAKVEAAKSANIPMVGGIYKRTRYEHGIKVQRAEIRFDKIAGCLRTPAGGSSRQLIMRVTGEKTESRLLSARETARLMGLNDSYRLPKAYNEAYHLTGDGVAVPVVVFLRNKLFEPILNSNSRAMNTEYSYERCHALRT